MEEGEMATDGLEMRMRLAKGKRKREKQDRNMEQQRVVPTSNESIHTGDTDALNEDRDEVNGAASRSMRSMNDRDDSIRSLYHDWIKWMVENDYAKSEEHGRKFMGVTPRPSMSPRIQSKTCLASPWARDTKEEVADDPDDRLSTIMQHIPDEDGKEFSNSCLTDLWGTSPSRFRDENGRSAWSEAPWLGKYTSSQPSDEQVAAPHKRLSKLSIRCIVGGPRDIRDGNESIALAHDKYEAVEQETRQDEPMRGKFTEELRFWLTFLIGFSKHRQETMA